MLMRSFLLATLTLSVSQTHAPVFASALAQKDAVTVAELLAKLVENKELGLKTGSTCQKALQDLVKPETLAKEHSKSSDDPLRELSFPPFQCKISYGDTDTPLTVSAAFRPDMKKLSLPASNSGARTIMSTDAEQVLASESLPLRIKARRLGKIDGVPVIFEASPDSMAGAWAFLDITRQLDTGALKIPDGWHKHIGAFRRVQEIPDASGFYSFSEPDNPFLEGVINADGEILIQPEFDDIDMVKHGFIVRTEDGLTGLISAEGKTVLPVEHKAIADKGGKHLLVYHSDDRLQVFDAATREFLGEKHDGITFVDDENLVIVKDDGRHQFMTRDMTPAFGEVYSYVRQLNSNRFVVEADGLASLLDNEGKILIPPGYERLWAHANHRLIYARKGKQTAYFDYDGRQVSPKGWLVHYAPSAEKGYITVSDPEGRFGVLDKSGDIIIPAEYSQVHQFSEGYLPAAKSVGGGSPKEQRFGLVDEENNIVIPFMYDNLNLVHDARLWARKDGKWGLIGIDQSIVADFTIDEISRSASARDGDDGKERRFIVAKRDGLYGIVRHDTGEIVAPFKYPEARVATLQLREGDQWLSYPCDFKPELNRCNGRGRSSTINRLAPQ